MTFALLAALSVLGGPELGCPDRATIVERLGKAGIVLRDEDNVRVRFSSVPGKLIAEIEVPGSTPRKIEHDGEGCSSLGEATIALLTVLLDERISDRGPRKEPQPSTPPPPSPREDVGRLRGEVGLAVSSGIVAKPAFGPSIGVVYRPFRWGAIGAIGEIWPQREHSVGAGKITVSATTLGLVLCGGNRFGRLSLEGCGIGHAGLYNMSGEGFPVVRSVDRALFAAELAIRVAVTLGAGIGVFMRGGGFLPFTPFDVGVRGVDGGFATSFGPKGVIGLELNE